jgi:hypothetical protein
MRRLSTALLASTLLCSSGALAQSAPTAADIAALKAQVQALTEQVNRLEAQEAASTQAAAAAQAAAQAAQAQAQAVQTAAAAPSPAPVVKLPDWIGNTKIGGRAYINVSSINQKSDGVDTSQNGTQTDVKRFYLIVDHKFNDVFSANLTTDFRYNANGTNRDTLVYVKNAYLQATLAPQFFVRVGSAPLPWVPFDESVYGYRFVENTVIDRTKFGTSADWGVHVGGTFGHGLINYAVAAINGAGFKTLSRSSDTVDLEGRVDVHPIKPITLAVGGYAGKLGKSAANLPDSATPHQARRFDALAAWTDAHVRAGVEYFSAKNWNSVTSPLGDKSNGWSVFGSYAFLPQFSVFSRYDWVKPSRDLNPALRDRYFNVGVDYKPIVPLDLALVYKRERANHGVISTSNGLIGGVDRGTYDEFGIFTQLSF